MVIYNPEISHSDLSTADLTLPFAIFSTQLRILLGVPITMTPLASTKGRNWQLESILRQRIIETSREAVDTLVAIIKLAKEISNMRVGEDVRSDIVQALDNLAKVGPLARQRD